MSVAGSIANVPADDSPSQLTLRATVATIRLRAVQPSPNKKGGEVEIAVAGTVPPPATKRAGPPSLGATAAQPGPQLGWR